VRFWLARRQNIMSVDNASVGSMNYAALASNVNFVEWRDAGEGEVEYSDRPPMRESTIDVLPYCPYFDQFLLKLVGITLTQAKKVKKDLIAEVYNTKRQAPFHYVVAAGDYFWDATDATLFSSTIPAIQNATASINAIVTALNAVVAYYNSNFVNAINGNATIGNANATIANILTTQLGALVAEINSSIVDATNLGFNSVDALDASIYAQGNALVSFLNITTIASLNAATVPIGSALLNSPLLPITGIDFAAGGSNPNRDSYVSAPSPGTQSVGMISTTAAPWTNLSPVATSNVQWIPVGGTAPVTVTPAEQAAILNGIAVRSADLNTKKNTKTNAVNACTTIGQVIAYDVTTGW
jgi:hypothetical protein